ncbi:MAG TPA: GAF domain-containing protein [Candidatus Acidoferrales bacterium]|nr:GAF domain-containing protein [Candidatus Acidoferrales bacterium]
MTRPIRISSAFHPEQMAFYSRHAIESSKIMFEQARWMWFDAQEAIDEVRQMRASLHNQIEDLALHDGFRRRYTQIMLPHILSQAISSTRADMGTIQLLDSLSARLRILVQSGFLQPFLQQFGSVHASQAVFGRALQSGCRIQVPDVTVSEIFFRSPCLEVLLDAGARSVQSTPLLSAKGEVIGVLSTYYRRIKQLGKRELHSIDFFASWAAALLDWQSGDATLFRSLF